MAGLLFRLVIDMKLGIALEGIRSASELARLAARVEELGFDSLWTPDHIAYSQPIADGGDLEEQLETLARLGG